MTNAPSGESAAVGLDDEDGSRGPSITAKVGTASNSSNSLVAHHILQAVKRLTQTGKNQYCWYIKQSQK